MSKDYFIKLIHRHRFYLLITMLIGMGAGQVIYHQQHVFYVATATFYVSARPDIDFHADIQNAYSELNPSDKDAYYIQQMFLLSNEMSYALIKQFNLYQHYGIDTTQPYAFEKVTRKLNERMRLDNKLSICLFELSFKDKDDSFAVYLANFTVAKLQQMNRAIIFDKIKEKIQFYKFVLNNVNDESEKISQRLAVQIKMFSDITKNSKFDPVENEKLLNFQNSLFSLTTDLRQANQNMSNVNNMYQLCLKGLRDDDFPIINQMQKAIPSDRMDGNYSLEFGCLGFLVSGIAYLIVLFFIITYKREIKIIFKGHE